MSITFGGLASGLDTNAIIEALLAVERRPIDLLQNQKSEQENKLSLFGTLEGLVDAFREKAASLSASTSVLSFALSSSDESVATFSLQDGALEGSTTIDVLSLASADRYATKGVPATNLNLGQGRVQFTYDGVDYNIRIKGNDSSLDEIASTINTEAGEAVTASVVNTGTEQNPSYQLVVSGNKTGADFALEDFTISVNPIKKPTQITTAANAIVEVDGLQIQRSTNEFNDVIPGLSFTAQALGSTTVTVSQDREQTKAELGEFVDFYNAIIEFVNEQNTFDVDAGAGGALFGDSALTTLRSTLTNALFNVDLATVQADTEGFSTLGLVGFDIQSDGTIKIDEAKLDSKLDQDPNLFDDLFTGDTTGVLVRLDQALDDLLDSQKVSDELTVDGLFDRRKDTINEQIGDLDDSIERLERNLALVEEQLVRQFANLESLIGALNAQSQFLATNLAFPTQN